MNWIQSQYIIKNRLSVESLKKDWEIIKHSETEVLQSDLHDIKWLWEASVTKLMEWWITTKEELKNASKEDIRKIIKNPLTLKNIFTFIS